MVVWVVQRATRPVRDISAALLQRSENDLAPIDAAGAPRELLPLIDATNQVMARLAHLLADQKRFVRDTAHQLRTPLAVLRTQLQSAQRGDVGPVQALREMSGTVERATMLANQMLALAKVEQLRQQGQAPVVDWAEITARGGPRPGAADRRTAARLRDRDRAGAGARPRVGAARADAQPAAQRHQAHCRNRPLSVRLGVDGPMPPVTIADSGPGIAAELRLRLFQPFAAGDPHCGSGLGLAICHEIVNTLGGGIRLDNRERAWPR